MEFTTIINPKDTWSFQSTAYLNQIFVNGLSGYDGRIVLNGVDINSNFQQISNNITNISNISSNWNSVYTTVNLNSANWEETTDINYLSAQIDKSIIAVTDISNVSGNWNSAYTTVNLNSSIWMLTAADINLGDIPSLSSNWNSTYTTVCANSAYWDSGGGAGESTIELLLSSNSWNSTYTTVCANSAYWSNAYTNLVSNSAAYLSGVDISLLASTSGNWDSTYTTVLTNSALWVKRNEQTLAIGQQVEAGFQSFTQGNSVTAQLRSLAQGEIVNVRSYTFAQGGGISASGDYNFIQGASIIAGSNNFIIGQNLSATNDEFIWGNSVPSYGQYTASLGVTALHLSGSNSNQWNSTYTTVNTNSSNWDYQGTDIKDITGNFVPYISATQSVNLGLYNLTAKNLYCDEQYVNVLNVLGPELNTKIYQISSIESPGKYDLGFTTDNGIFRFDDNAGSITEFVIDPGRLNIKVTESINMSGTLFVNGDAVVTIPGESVINSNDTVTYSNSGWQVSNKPNNWDSTYTTTNSNSANWSDAYTNLVTNSAIYLLSGVSGNFLTLDQTIPQSVVSGAPIFDAIEFNRTSIVPASTGRMVWNASDETVNLKLNGQVTLQIGQETLIRVVNKTGVDIPDGTAVTINGAQGQRPKIILAGNSIDHYTGLTTQHIPKNQEGFVTVRGLIRDIDTTGQNGETWVDGDTLWVSKAVPGGLTNIEPPIPHHCDRVGIVVYAHSTQGIILVDKSAHKTLEELADVDGTPLTGTGQFPVWSSTLSAFDFNYNINDYAPSTILGQIPTLSGNWNSTYTTVTNNSGNWSNAYTNLVFNSAAYLTGVDISLLATTSGNWNSVYTNVNSNSANWNSVYTNVNSNSANWQSTYTTVTGLSTVYAKLDGSNQPFTGTVQLRTGTAGAGTSPIKFFSGTLLTNPEAGAVEFLTDKYYTTITTGAVRKEVALLENTITDTHIPFGSAGRLSSNANLTFNNTTKTLTISGGNGQSSIGAGLIVNNGNDNTSIGSFQVKGANDNNLIFTSASANNIGIGTNNPTTKLHLSGSLTIEDGYNIVLQTTTGTKFGTASNQKIGFYNTTPVVQPSGDILVGLGALGLIYNPTLTSFSSNSANWNSSYTTVNNTSANWSAVYTTVNNTSALWNSTNTAVNSNSANWNSSYTTVNSNSASWLTNSTADLRYVNVSGDIMTGSLSTINLSAIEINIPTDSARIYNNPNSTEGGNALTFKTDNGIFRFEDYISSSFELVLNGGTVSLNAPSGIATNKLDIIDHIRFDGGSIGLLDAGNWPSVKPEGRQLLNDSADAIVYDWGMNTIYTQEATMPLIIDHGSSGGTSITLKSLSMPDLNIDYGSDGLGFWDSDNDGTEINIWDSPAVAYKLLSMEGTTTYGAIKSINNIVFAPNSQTIGAGDDAPFWLSIDGANYNVWLGGTTASYIQNNNDGLVLDSSNRNITLSGTQVKTNKLLAKGYYTNVKTVTSNYNVLDSDDIMLCNAISGSITIRLFNLPQSFTEDYRKTLTVKKIDNTTNTVIISAIAGSTIDGLTNQIITTQYSSLTLTNDNANWYII